VHRLLWPAVVLACCSIAVDPAGAQNTPSGRVGAYYFDGWAGPPSTFFFNGLIGGQYNGRRPLTGWRDDTAQSLDKQLSWAGDAGIGFFAFDWYFGAESRTDGTESLNHALGNYRAMSDHHGVNFALLYVNAPPFEIPAADWPAVSEAWVGDMANPSYERVEGKPILLILNSFSLSAQLGGEQGVNRVFSGLREAARRRGLPGVFIIGGIAMQRGEDWNLSGRAALTGQTYDAMTQYNYVGYAGGAPGERVYQDVVGAEKAFWEVLATEPAYRYVPDVMAGWDPRPWNETFEGQLFWFKRSAAEVGSFLHDAVSWVNTHPNMAVEPPGSPPLVMVESWNELGEGAQILPTDEARFTFLQAIAQALDIEWTPPTWQLTIKIALHRGAITVRPVGTVCRTTCTVTVTDDAEVTLVATPTRGYRFQAWSACVTPRLTCRLRIQDDVAVTALFRKKR
jgi:Glycosyltransferase WbsX/Divergent InlB B-repeat domain